MNPYHLSGCKDYKLSQASSGSGEAPVHKRSSEATTEEKPPKARRVSDINERSPPKPQELPWLLDPNCNVPTNHVVSEKKRPPDAAPPQSKAGDQALSVALSWACLCCGQTDCTYEASAPPPSNNQDGPSSFPEWDALEPKTHNNSSGPQEIPNGDVTKCIKGMLSSRTFFAWNKFVGTATTELRIKQWMEIKLSKSPAEVARVWPALRQAAKETIGWKRRQCIERIKETFIGKKKLQSGACLRICL